MWESDAGKKSTESQRGQGKASPARELFPGLESQGTVVDQKSAEEAASRRGDG